MPSGAKKRKAAKKKKGLQVKVAPNSTQPHTHGEEELDHTCDKDSDGGDASSPASQDYHNCNELMDQEEEIDKQDNDGSHNHSSTVHENKPDNMTNEGDRMETPTIEEGSDLHARREFNFDESHPANKESTVVVGLVKQIDYLSARKGNDEVGTVFTNDLDKAAISKNEADIKKSDGFGVVENVEENAGGVHKDDSLSEGLVKMESSKKEDEVVQTSLKGDAEALMDFAIQVNGEKVTPSVYCLGDTGTGQEEDEGVPVSLEEKVRMSKPEAFAATDEEGGDILTLSYNAPKIEADPFKDSKLSELSDSQPQNGLYIRPVQTSWKGCCGLLDLFKGSNR
ncbi:unnamed protein product [Cuscuta epithymum]|uniref:Uncharacterized protein n=1 Tax=Cuscuta epithymum TaxID=186058 RepID=A0AAV0EJ06_9ASTE|nr:unnamed protein product [Cuscuta epithymum]